MKNAGPQRMELLSQANGKIERDFLHLLRHQRACDDLGYQLDRDGRLQVVVTLADDAFMSNIGDGKAIIRAFPGGSEDKIPNLALQPRHTYS